MPLEPATEDALKSIAADMKIGRADLIQIMLREWLETYFPVRVIDETNGSASARASAITPWLSDSTLCYRLLRSGSNFRLTGAT